ncbi:ROK family glucokinase [Lysinibacillus piscis]|uniref:Glucokinase n=1 Tax=Lysinibacillus piscis TaxID=2518931 RepID=A0ABQ5NGE9_9BACI|nr:ROK family glucokinase [Lysinibacillus sp. KH24]GLC87350.1 glucokinase [Lysinibacillus sp. KH24]
MKKLLGIDLGGTTVKFAILTEAGDILKKWTIQTNVEQEGQHIVPDIIQSIKECLQQEDLTAEDFVGIGMGSPGSVDIHNGTVIGAYNLNWRTLQPVKAQIEQATGIPCYVDNDANVAALGEQWQGAGDGSANVVFITLGTGVGGGIVSEGKLIHGVGAAGEIGHMNVDPNGYLCTCGNVGCLETVASATGIVRLAQDMAQTYKESSSLHTWITNGQEVTAKLIFDKAKEGDLFAQTIVDKFSFYLGYSCGNIANILHPETIVIGGGVSAAGDILLQGVQKYFEKAAFLQVRETTKLKLAQLGNDAGVIGAASLVHQFTI